MKILIYIPSSMFVLGAAIWDIWAPTIEYRDIVIPDNMATWCISYYLNIYLAWFIHCVMEAIRTDKVYFGALGVGIGVRVFDELKRIGMNYYEYSTSANDYHSGMMLVLWSALVLVIIPILRWKK